MRNVVYSHREQQTAWMSTDFIKIKKVCLGLPDFGFLMIQMIKGGWTLLSKRWKGVLGRMQVPARTGSSLYAPITMWANTVLGTNLHLGTMASEHNEHTLSGKLLHLQEQFVHLIMNKTNKKKIVCVLENKALFYNCYTIHVFFPSYFLIFSRWNSNSGKQTINCFS